MKTFAGGFICNKPELQITELSMMHLSNACVFLHGMDAKSDDAVQDLLKFADDVFLGIENADFDTKRRTMAMLKIDVVVKDKRFYVESVAGQWEGSIRKLPRSRGISKAKEGDDSDLRLPAQSLLVFRFHAGLRLLVG